MINPSLVIGPGLDPRATCESFKLVRQLGDGKLKPACPTSRSGWSMCATWPRRICGPLICFEPGLRQRLSSIDAGASMSERVKAVLLENLPAGQHRIDTVARMLTVSRRTLQRLLSDESTSFTTVLNATHDQLAAHYLKRPAIAQGQIAFLPGCQDMNSFNRAFKQWAGVSPGNYRQHP